MIPSSTPYGPDPVEFQVVRASTNAVLASFLYRIDPFSPGLFLHGPRDANGTAPLAVINQDNSINDAMHPAKAGSIISLYGTGQGVVSNAPPDGTPGSGLLPTPISPRVIINAKDVSSTVTYSGLAPSLVGVWQINVQVPTDAPNGADEVAVCMVDVCSVQDPSSGKFFRGTIRVSQ